MFISEMALALLGQGRIDELQALPLRDLLSHNSYRELMMGINNPHDNVSTGGSLPRQFMDPVWLSSIQNACVLSTGLIYCITSASKLPKKKPQCPQTNLPLKLIAGRNAFYLPLPQIDVAVEVVRKKQSEAVASSSSSSSGGEATPSLAPDLAAQESSSSSAAQALFDGAVSLSVTNGKLKLLVDLHSPNFSQSFSAFCTVLDIPKVVIPPDCCSYKIDANYFCLYWTEVSDHQFEIVLSFPRYQFDESDLNSMIAHISSTLGLIPQGVEEDEFGFMSISQIPPKHYYEVLSEMGASMAVIQQCSHAFLTRSRELAQTKSIEMTNEIGYSTQQARGSTFGGAAMFGAPPAGGAAPSHGASSMTQSQWP
jgi:hypothetical protein